ncbi:MAG: anthranilate phosphoribosyltransferase [Pantoea sp. Brub]|nr:anthranilate phosphoribosyltransferase [Pantoea sp. Brub]
MNNILEKVYKGKILNQLESYQLFHSIIKGQLNTIQLSAVLIAMKVRGEKSKEILGALTALLENAKSFPRPYYDFADIVGTGGSEKKYINVSTISAIVAAICGLKIVKHGNKGISNKFGSSNLLEELKINLDISAELSRKMLDDLNICFLLASKYHTGFSNTMLVRKQLQTRTIFNILGPLLNPARPKLALIGVYTPKLVLPIAKILKTLGYHRAAVVHGDGIDEISLNSNTYVAELCKGEIHCYQLTAESFGFYSKKILSNMSIQNNYKLVIELLQGKGKQVYEETIAINVAMLLKIFGNEDLRENAHFALTKIRSGQAYELVLALSGNK